VALRASSGNDGHVFVSVDFEVKDKEHVTAPVGKGKSIAPNITWENTEVVDIFWPASVDLPDSVGAPSGYRGYDKNFSVVYKLKVINKTMPINYNLSYVVCGDACVPHQKSGILEINGSLSNEEIENIHWNSNDAMPNFLLMLLFGLLGGVILNFMPCVFPIVSMKIFSIVKMTQSNRKNIRKHGMSFLFGILSVFVLIGVTVTILRQSISGIGWGFYMQEPTFVFALLLVFLFCSLHFLGIFRIQIPAMKRIKLPIKNEYIASFCSGMFGGLSSSACVGPFSGVALASAILYGNLFQSIGIFAALGIGMGSPFLLLSIFPNFVKRIPRPGRWLSLFEEFMGFAMLFSCVWPIWILLSQVPASSLIVLLICCISIVMFIWMLKQIKKSRISKYLVISGVFVSILTGIYTTTSIPNSYECITWVNYSDKVFDDTRAEKSAIFLDFTASWCINCQFNERLFSDEDVICEFQKRNIKAIKCDWTNRNEKVTNMLKVYGAIAVPLYVFYPRNGKNFIVLPTILTKKILLDTITQGDN
jgi:thiol:disulfide interchange protein DsbD